MKNIAASFVMALLLLHTVTAQEKIDTLCILQLNDVYEIAPLDHGTVGGMARVATVIKQHESRYQTFVVLAGDFVSPSVIGTTRIDGQRVNGKQMVDLMNMAGVDLVTFGNHEFDIPEKDLQQRINESKFKWVSSDVLHRDSTGTLTRFLKTAPDSTVLPTYHVIASEQGQFKVGIVTATIQSNKQPWVAYEGWGSVKKALKQVRKQSDIVVGLTHLTLDEDRRLSKKLKRVPLLMGGHEHQHNFVTDRKRSIAKADANAKTMYRHLVFRSGKRSKMNIISELVHLDTTVVPDPAVDSAVKIWEEKAYASFRAVGLEPTAVVYHTNEPLDGTEASVRNKQTNLGTLIAASMMAASPQADGALFNSGSIRIDDMVDGVLTQLDIIRILPFGGKLCEVELTGTLLGEVLHTSNSLRGSGGYLQTSGNIIYNEHGFTISGQPIDPTKTYRFVSSEFLFSGAEKGLEFLKEGNPGIKSIKRFDAPGDIHTDLRLAAVKYLAGLDLKPE